MTNIILIGPPGSGKGYISNRIIKDHNKINHISTGIILREYDLIIRIINSKIKNSSSVLLLDGFPRNLEQAKSLDIHYVKIVIVLKVDDNICLERIINRQDNREDDTDKSIIKKRIQMYHDITKPVIDFYKDKTTVCFVNGNENKENVYKQIQDIFHSVQEIMENDQAEIRVDTRLVTDIKVSHNKPDIMVGITNQDRLSLVENEKLRKCDLLANELGIIHKCKTRIVSYVMTWDARNPTKLLGIYTSISLERRRGHDWSEAGEDEIGGAVEKLLIRIPYKVNIIEEAKPKRFENKMSFNDKSKEKHGEKQIVNLNGKNINVN
ncbi:adenylate kinase [Vairimorpha apis BRL 01]|uniref:Adenylate kinase n=1 Tax=Vairimorpha apis BRL 01 TaxID=1037528 RepID=T0LD03_9MICR|nr:adenylate kinase [Vairimorpha apis BRL 01]